MLTVDHVAGYAGDIGALVCTAEPAGGAMTLMATKARTILIRNAGLVICSECPHDLFTTALHLRSHVPV